jgi:phosphodiesterase/alkaline phosphatase D-like protein
MDSNDPLTQAEHNVLDEARKLLGDNLADFLFSGLGESRIVHHRSFTAKSMLGQADEITYHFEMINDSELGLPIGRDPLVLATLLDILLVGAPASGQHHSLPPGRHT